MDKKDILKSVYEDFFGIEKLARENERIAQKSSKMKDKLLRYSVPITEEDGTEMVDMRFYNNEITDLFYVLFYGIENMISIETNYYDVLVRVREKIKENKTTNE